MSDELDYITIRGFRSLRAVENLELRPVNVLIGANGAGKSNFVAVYDLLHAILNGRLEEYAKKRSAESLLWFGSKKTKRIDLEVSFQKRKNGYRVSLERTQDDSLRSFDEKVWYWDAEKYDQPLDKSLSPQGREAGISDPRASRIPKHVREHLAKWRVYHFHDTSDLSPMKGQCALHDNRHLRADGSNLPAFLFALQETHSDAFNLIGRTLQRVAPFFDSFQLQPSVLNPDLIRLEWRHKSSDLYFDANALSDGTLRFLCLATLFLQPLALRPSVIIVDEPELGLHPYAITMLASLIKSASKETQVIVATQSPQLLDHFEPEDVLVAERSHDATELRRLSSAELNEWLEDFSLGQLWEKNQFGGRPTCG